MPFDFSTLKIPEYVKNWDKSLLPLIEKNSLQHKIDIRYLCALIQTESSGRTNACRFEKNYPWIQGVSQLAKTWKITEDTATTLLKTSWGLTQVMGSLAVELGLLKYPLLPHDLCRPENGIFFGCLAWNQKKDKFKLSSPLDIYAAYNAGSVRMNGDKYFNQKAVDNFNINLNQF